MNPKPHIIVMIISLLICVLISSCTGIGDTESTQTTVPVTSTLVPTKPPTSMPTETPVPSPTPIPSPTPVPGEFLNRPAYLQELFSNTDWVWVDHSIGATVGTFQYNSSSVFMLVYGTNEETADDIMLRGAFAIDSETRSEDEAFFHDLIAILLEDFLPVPAREELLQFIAEHPDLGTYESTLYGFEIFLLIKDDSAKNAHNYVLSVNEKQEE